MQLKAHYWYPKTHVFIVQFLEFHSFQECEKSEVVFLWWHGDSQWNSDSWESPAHGEMTFLQRKKVKSLSQEKCITKNEIIVIYNKSLFLRESLVITVMAASLI